LTYQDPLPTHPAQTLENKAKASAPQLQIDSPHRVILKTLNAKPQEPKPFQPRSTPFGQSPERNAFSLPVHSQQMRPDAHKSAVKRTQMRPNRSKFTCAKGLTYFQ
jgi:hypothetical protein